MNLPMFTLNDIRTWKPCLDPGIYADENWIGCALDVLVRDDIPAEYRLWTVLRPECIDEKVLRLFIISEARIALSAIENPDEQCVKCLDVAERRLHGEATEKEVDVFRKSVWDIAWNAKESECRPYWAALDAARYDVKYAARDVVWDITHDYFANPLPDIDKIRNYIISRLIAALTSD